MNEKKVSLLKILKVFLVLKWRETAGAIRWSSVGSFFLMCLLAVIGGFAFSAVGWCLGRLWYYAGFVIYSDPWDIWGLGMLSVFALLVLGFVFYQLYKRILIFIRWIRSNWREARRIACTNSKTGVV